MAVIQEAWIGGVSTRRVDDLVQAMGLSRHLQEHGLEAVQGHRRAGAGVPRPADRGRLALPLARRHLPQGARGREDRLRRRDNRHGGRHRRTARDHRPVRRPLRGGDLLDRLPTQPGEPRAAGREAGDLRRARPASRPPSREFSRRPGKDAGFTGSGTRSPMCPRASTPSSPPRSGRPSTSPTRKPPSRPGATSPTSSAPAGPSSPT